MKLIGLLNWYQEDPTWLSAAITSYAKIGLNHLVAADGAYWLYPAGTPWSGTEQHTAIIETCNALGIGCTIAVPSHRWMGNEVEKRSFLFATAELIAKPHEDWYVVIDADEVVTKHRVVYKALQETDLDVAELTLWNRRPRVKPELEEQARNHFIPHRTQFPIRKFFRAIPGLRVVGNHYTYQTPDGRNLWSNKDQAPALNLCDIEVEHRTDLRDLERRAIQKAYYTQRDELKTEMSKCYHCDEVAKQFMPSLWETIGGMPASTSIEVCAKHAVMVRKANTEEISALGFRPEQINNLKRGEHYL